MVNMNNNNKKKPTKREILRELRAWSNGGWTRSWLFAFGNDKGMMEFILRSSSLALICAARTNYLLSSYPYSG